MQDLINKVIIWAQDRNLVEGSNPKRQVIKTLEECTELVDAIIKNDRIGIVDGIGDVIVTLIVIAEQCNLSIDSCLDHAYQDIKDRKGKMIDGVFVKESDL